jgi:hypothetical protein
MVWFWAAQSAEYNTLMENNDYQQLSTYSGIVFSDLEIRYPACVSEGQTAAEESFAANTDLPHASVNQSHVGDESAQAVQLPVPSRWNSLEITDSVEHRSAGMPVVSAKDLMM